MTTRVAVTNAPLDQVLPYLPSNYTAHTNDVGETVIVGHDHAGWNLEDYVVPRLASGLIFARIVS